MLEPGRPPNIWLVTYELRGRGGRGSGGGLIPDGNRGSGGGGGGTLIRGGILPANRDGSGGGIVGGFIPGMVGLFNI